MSPNSFDGPQAVVIGAGVGGLACAMRLQASGTSVMLLDMHDAPGGKMRTVPSAAGPVDAGPTVLTMRPIFEDLFDACGTRLSDHVQLTRQDILARHFWPDGGQLDLFEDPARSAHAIEAFAGPEARAAFERFWMETETLFETFEGPMLHSAEPSQLELATQALSQPRLLPALSPVTTMARWLARRFPDPRLAQLFGRYATYVGGSPFESPALLSLIWQAEARGVWTVKGGMHKLAQAMSRHFVAMGGVMRMNTRVTRIDANFGRVTGVVLDDGTRLDAPLVVFNGDPRALATGKLGPHVSQIARPAKSDPRSYSARVWSFAARVSGPPLAHHNVFFSGDIRSEFSDLKAGRLPVDPSIYICAEDRGNGGMTQAPQGLERFEIILNAAPLTKAVPIPQEAETCLTQTFDSLARFGLRFDPLPDVTALTTPTDFDRLFPETAGSLYGQSPHGLTASLRRPRARTGLRGFYLVGGGVHPGAGVPMATLSARHAAEAIATDLALT